VHKANPGRLRKQQANNARNLANSLPRLAICFSVILMILRGIPPWKPRTRRIVFFSLSQRKPNFLSPLHLHIIHSKKVALSNYARLLAIAEASAEPPVIAFHWVSVSQGLSYVAQVRLGGSL
jgi:hypothetical protein